MISCGMSLVIVAVILEYVEVCSSLIGCGKFQQLLVMLYGITIHVHIAATLLVG